MRPIKTSDRSWLTQCREAAAAGEPFYVEHLSEADAAFLDALSQRLKRPNAWSADRTTFYFMPVGELPLPTGI